MKGGFSARVWSQLSWAQVPMLSTKPVQLSHEADLHLACLEGNTAHLPDGNLSGIFQLCLHQSFKWTLQEE